MSFAMVGDLLESLGDMNLFITLDMTKAYHQGYKKKSQEK